jgi:hypothetical protein
MFETFLAKWHEPLARILGKVAAFVAIAASVLTTYQFVQEFQLDKLTKQRLIAWVELDKKQLPAAKEKSRELFEELAAHPNIDLYVLKSTNEVCQGALNCRGLPEKDAKQLVEAALAYQTAKESSSFAWRGLVLSACSLFISFSALVVGVLALRIRRKEGAITVPLPPTSEEKV